MYNTDYTRTECTLHTLQHVYSIVLHIIPNSDVLLHLLFQYYLNHSNIYFMALIYSRALNLIKLLKVVLL